MRRFKRLLCLIGALCLCLPIARADERIVKDAENGLWEYETQDLQIRIRRVEDADHKLIWYEVDVRTSDHEPLKAILTNAQKPGTSFKNPVWIARSNRYVLAVNDDYFGDRVYNKETVGLVIRGGKVISTKTYRKSGTILPNLDSMALYPDGRAEPYACGEVSADELIEKGAKDVLSFGPILIRDGMVNEKLQKAYRSAEPRVGFGIIEPHHYVFVVVEGRHGKSRGANLQWLADRLLELGAVNALNLDGGQTSALIFMGEKLNRTGKFGSASKMRNLSSMLAVGYSSEVPDYK